MHLEEGDGGPAEIPRLRSESLRETEHVGVRLLPRLTVEGAGTRRALEQVVAGPSEREAAGAWHGHEDVVAGVRPRRSAPLLPTVTVTLPAQVGPAGPSAPVAPTCPAGPWAPAGPCAPVAPATPSALVAPGTPCAPVEPAAAVAPESGCDPLLGRLTRSHLYRPWPR